MSKAQGHHAHALPSSRNERSLRIALALTGSFLVVEVAGGDQVGGVCDFDARPDRVPASDTGHDDHAH